ncbi:SAM-dependent methyltransferase [Campylobacter iguaniorum]|uniref:SAM-dependent methyltransferase n=1 Tax=Campylobacter iguaniorum TaxID=1244531 RepID=A0A076FHS2_9BACT|nr:methyltransferase domain-containing protein [Campylobacter iguaniorum]AII15324.1 SAM-dependent methyltransferase [Campylobacter iguaniorum]
MNLDEKLKKSQRLEGKTYYITEYLYRVLIIQRFILLPLVKTKITPNQITIVSFLFVSLCFYYIFTHQNLLAGLSFFIYSLLDHIDGMLARYKNLSSKIGHYLDVFVDEIAFNAVFIVLYISYDIDIFALLAVLIMMNLHGLVCTFYIVKKLRKLKQIYRFGIKKFLFERGFILGIDASLLAILIVCAITTQYYDAFFYLIAALFLIDVVYRYFELRANISINDSIGNLYWENFYKANSIPFAHSLFSSFCLDNYFLKNYSLLELGCGNGRDAVFLSKNGIKVTAVDACKNEIEFLQKKYQNNSLHFKCENFCELATENESYDVVYSRFTIHSINASQQKKLFSWVVSALKTNGLFCIEVRGMKNSLFGKGEEISENEYIFQDHYRRFLDFDMLCNDLKCLGFQIIFAKEDKGFAPFEDEDDVFIRVIAKK